MPKVNNIRDLIYEYTRANPDGHFFDRDTLKFFGERRSEMRLLKTKEVISDSCGEKHECYVISTIQRPGPPLKNRRVYFYFDTTTFDNIIK